MNVVSAVLLLPSVLAMLAARFFVARELGMRGLRFFGGRVENGDAATPARRAIVLLSGLVASYLVAVVFFWAAFVVGGRFVIDPGSRVTILPGGPAAAAGLQDGDRIVSIAGVPVTKWEELAAEISKRPDVPTEVAFDRGAERQAVTITPRAQQGKGRIGIAATQNHLSVGVGEALAIALIQPARVNVETVRSLLDFLTLHTKGELVGPVGMVREAARATERGASDLLYFLGVVLAYVWPLTAIAALVLIPRRTRPVVAPAG